MNRTTFFATSLLSICVSLAHAETSTLSRCFATIPNGSFTDEQSDSGVGASASACRVAEFDARSHGYPARVDVINGAFASNGVLKASSASFAQMAAGNGGGDAQFSGYFTINSPGNEGRQGVFTVGMVFDYVSRLEVNNSVDTWYTAENSMAVTLQVGHSSSTRGYSLYQSQLERIETWTAFDNGAPVNFADPISFTVPFTVGEAIWVQGSLFAGSQASGANVFSSLVANQSAYWTGISGLLIEGTAVPYTVTSDSGFNWAQSMVPIPEPHSRDLMLLGLPVLLAWGGRRTKGILSEGRG